MQLKCIKSIKSHTVETLWFKTVLNSSRRTSTSDSQYSQQRVHCEWKALYDGSEAVFGDTGSAPRDASLYESKLHAKYSAGGQSRRPRDMQNWDPGDTYHWDM